MPYAKSAAACRLYAASILSLALVSAGHAKVRVLGTADYLSHKITCESPVKLIHDCSIWQGATRPIAFGEYRMTLAADGDGKTILLSRLRRGPSHNGTRFSSRFNRQSRESRSIAAIQSIGEALEERGIRLERMQTVRRGRRVDGYFLEFSDNAYDYLKQFTVLESEHWLPISRAAR